MHRASPFLLALALTACRIETAAPGQGAAAAATAGPSGEVWVYTSMYRHVLDALDPLIAEQLPDVKVHWFQAGSEKVASRLEAELAAGGTQCDVLLTSDPFLYQRFKKEGRWLRYVSPNGVRTPQSLVDPDGHFQAVRLSTMVLVTRRGAEAPAGFAELADARFKGEVALGDPLTSGTAFTWAVFEERARGQASSPACGPTRRASPAATRPCCRSSRAARRRWACCCSRTRWLRARRAARWTSPGRRTARC